MNGTPMRQPASDAAFEQSVVAAFSFLLDSDFKIVERSKTLVRYACKNIEIDIYQGRKSFEIGVGVAIDGEKFSLSELIRIHDPTIANAYRNPVATDNAGVASGVSRVVELFKQFGLTAVTGDASDVAALIDQRRQWSDTFALDVLVEQTRPRAEHAFKSGDYVKAAELYARIRSRLSPAEKGKLELAEARSSTRH